jgi:hypothetical protein
MRRLFLVLLVAGMLLSACTGGPSDATIPDPPAATVFQPGSNQQINQILAGWQEEVPAIFRANAVKPETIQERLFTSTATVQEIADFYQGQMTSKGWFRAARMPNVQQEGSILITGYEAGTYDLVIGAFDAAQFGGTGTVIYIAHGNR